ncbi:histone H2AX-like [Stegostoma tigrinum]|uniref:histone H2AX-like n=1 Tax=Stegostoma tigrinum TaxID=3053191 RepID=UPI00202B2B0B|nr:histone H2AX-like [Stegostoma tigrinum]
MSGRGKSTGGKARSKTKSRSSRTGLQFPVGCGHRFLRKGFLHEHCYLKLQSLILNQLSNLPVEHTNGSTILGHRNANSDTL